MYRASPNYILPVMKQKYLFRCKALVAFILPDSITPGNGNVFKKLWAIQIIEFIQLIWKYLCALLSAKCFLVVPKNSLAFRFDFRSIRHTSEARTEKHVWLTGESINTLAPQFGHTNRLEHRDGYKKAKRIKGDIFIFLLNSELGWETLISY